LPDLYSDLPERNYPDADRNDYCFSRNQFDPLVRDMAYIFEVKANSELTFNAGNEELLQTHARRVFSLVTEEAQIGERCRITSKGICIS
jgi:hypothetical protein